MNILRFPAETSHTERFRPGKVACFALSLIACLFFLCACKPETTSGKHARDTEIPQEFAKADKGDAAAQFKVGLMFFKGEGVPQDYRQAYVWFDKAARQGLGEAQYNLGAMMEQGLGMEKNAALAKNWYEKAAAQGIGEAQYKLADLYLTGKGTTPNPARASEWMQKAAEQGVTEARERFSTLFASQTGDSDMAGIRSRLRQSVQTGGEKVKILQEKIRNRN